MTATRELTAAEIEEFEYFLWKCTDVGFEETFLEYHASLPDKGFTPVAETLKWGFLQAWGHVKQMAKDYGLEDMADEVTYP